MHDTNRRQGLGWLAACWATAVATPVTASIAGTWAAPARAASAAGPLNHAALQAELAALEARSAGVLGFAVLDSASGALAGHRVQQRFALCSTFKVLLAAAVLQRVEQGAWPADRRIAITAQDLVAHSPVTRLHLGPQGLTALQLAEATQLTSDNAAANLLLRNLMGGPAGLTDWLRSCGDRVTRLDRWEPAMNEVPPGHERDTTTPEAMARTLHTLLVAPAPAQAPAQAPVLSNASRERLIGWMRATTTGARRLRAGWPADWPAGDKTGTALTPGLAGCYNDVAIVWPGAGRAPWLVAAYFESPDHHSPKIRQQDEAVLAEAARLLVRWQPA